MNRWTAKLRVLAVAAVIAGGATVAGAQTRPMPPDPYQPQFPSTTAEGQLNGEYRPGDALPQQVVYVTDFPARQVEAVPSAKAAVVNLRQRFFLSQRDLGRMIDSMREEFMLSEEVSELSRQEQQAHEAMEAARRRVLQELSSDEHYRTLRDLSDDLKNKVQDLHQGSKTQHEAILANAELRLRYTSQLSAMEAEALSRDDEYQQARQRHGGASSRLSEMRQRFARTVRRDPDLTAHRQQIQELRIAYLTADAHHGALVNARNIALDYAYWLHRYDYYKYATANHYPYYGYGHRYYGYGTGYYSSRFIRHH